MLLMYIKTFRIEGTYVLVLMYLLDLHPLTVGAWSMSSLALKFSS